MNSHSFYNTLFEFLRIGRPLKIVTGRANLSILQLSVLYCILFIFYFGSKAF
jgi:hypothetical protein